MKRAGRVCGARRLGAVRGTPCVSILRSLVLALRCAVSLRHWWSLQALPLCPTVRVSIHLRRLFFIPHRGPFVTRCCRPAPALVSISRPLLSIAKLGVRGVLAPRPTPPTGTRRRTVRIAVTMSRPRGCDPQRFPPSFVRHGIGRRSALLSPSYAAGECTRSGTEAQFSTRDVAARSVSRSRSATPGNVAPSWSGWDVPRSPRLPDRRAGRDYTSLNSIPFTQYFARSNAAVRGGSHGRGFGRIPDGVVSEESRRDWPGG